MPSASRVNGVTAASTTTKVAPKSWQFVNVKEPKRIQDKEVTSLVRAHAMRNVRRKQRLEVAAQHQRKLKAGALGSVHANPGVTDEQPLPMTPRDRSLQDKVDTDRPIAIHEILNELAIIDLADGTSMQRAGLAAESDGAAQQPGHRQRDSEDGTQAPKHPVLGKYPIGPPRSLVGDGAFDPFNAMPMAGCPRYTGLVLNHCT